MPNESRFVHLKQNFRNNAKTLFEERKYKMFGIFFFCSFVTMLCRCYCCNAKTERVSLNNFFFFQQEFLVC